MAREAVPGTPHGVDTTGHEWDGIRELNTPLPKWWLYLFYATIAWAAVWYVLYPAWPTAFDYTRGILGYSQRADLAEALSRAAAGRAPMLDRVAVSSLEEVRQDPGVLQFALSGGRVVFADNCATCHRAGGAGGPGYPALADDDWLWGGRLDDIYGTVRYGIRSDHAETRYSEMPRFGADGILSEEDIDAVTEYVLSLAGAEHDPAALERGRAVFADNCVACHGEAGEGIRDVGGPRLSDAIWLYGEDRESIRDVVRNARRGVMPSWEGRLDDRTIKLLAVYVHALGGGE